MIKKDFMNWTKPSYVLLAIGAILQAYMLCQHTITTASSLTTIGAMCGIICVLMISNKKASNAIFGILSALIIIYNAWQHKIFADALLQIGYIVVLDIPVLLLWTKEQDDQTGEVTGIQKLSTVMDWAKYFLLAAIVTVVFTFILGLDFIGDKQPFVDSLGFAIGITGGVLCVKRNQSQFVFWGLQGVISMVLWFRASMIAGTGLLSPLAVMYVFYLLNDVIGWTSYGHSIKKEAVQ